MPPEQIAPTPPPRVALFVTCLVDLFRPTVGFATVKLLEDAGCHVEVPDGQTCCGQPAWNSGDRATAERIAKQTIAALEGYDYVVVPSGSCGGTIARDYPHMFDDEPDWRARAQALGARTHEIVSFLTDVMGVTSVPASYVGTATYHDSCSSLRHMGVKAQPRALLASVEGLTLKELAESEVCCGFGGTFCVKYPDISNRMASDKVADIAATGAELVLAGDMGCLMNIAGKLKRTGSTAQARHVVEVLADMAHGPAIAEGKP
ncbi:MAG: (Fe-S)-binding protein [Rubrimonas sp.]|uniref:(Fe-S)-binding protein n=1 Tax=Rubrimonas sp. TaxID=2036015 RepID=UPI002FDDEEAE